MSDCHKCMFLYDTKGAVVAMCQRYEMADENNVDNCEMFKQGKNYFECMEESED